MSDYIKREDAIDVIEITPFEDYGDYIRAREIIENLPTIEPKRGEWLWDKDAIDWNIGAWVCSNCHARNNNIPEIKTITPNSWSGSNFCPNCGARMKGADDD